MARTPTFDLANTTNDDGQASAGWLSSDTFDPFAPTQLLAADGFLVVLNGHNPNRLYNELTDSSGDPSEVSKPLQLIAPRYALYPLLSGKGTGKVFGTGLKWRYRIRDTSTGIVSGLSPMPEIGLNVGGETISGTQYYMGEVATLRLETSNVPSGGDLVEFFRNTSAQQDVFYKIGDAASGSTILFTDNFADEEIVNNETHLLDNCPSWSAGILGPVCKAYYHPTARTAYYHIRRFAPLASSECTLIQGSNKVVINSGGTMRYIEPGRINQRFRPITNSGLPATFDDETNYRIVQIDPDGYTFYVEPPIKASTAMPVGTTQASIVYRIEDDRSGRALTFSEPFKPWAINPENTLYIGDEDNDDIQAVFGMGGTTFVHTNKGLFALQNDFTEDPLLSAYVTRVSDEGMVGPDAGVMTPWGWVYLHRDLGVRIFSGGQSQPLGAQDGLTVFSPQTQFDGFAVGAMNTAVMAFDGYTGKVYLSYIGTGRSCLDQVMTYDFQTGVWRGPHPMRLQSVGRVLGSGGEDLQVFGDDLGNIYTPEASTGYDLVVNDVDNTMSGTVAGVTSDSFDCNSATFDGSGDKRLRGAPIWFESQAGVRYYSFIAEVDGDDVYLVHPPVTLDGTQGTLAAGWTFKVGGIGWRATTSYIDAGEPIQPKKALIGRTRFERVTASGGDFTFKVDPDDSGTFAGEATSVSTNGKIYAEPRFMVQGAAHKFRLEGLTQTAKPRITVAAVDMEVKSGKGTK